MLNVSIGNNLQYKGTGTHLRQNRPIWSTVFIPPKVTSKKDQVGDTFYLCNSSFEYFPGLPIHKSNDLVNWSWAGHGLHRQEQVGNAVGFDRSRGENHLGNGLGIA